MADTGAGCRFLADRSGTPLRTIPPAIRLEIEDAQISSEVETMIPRFAGQTRERGGAPVGLTLLETSVARENLVLTRQIEVEAVPDIVRRCNQYGPTASRFRGSIVFTVEF